MSRAFTLIELAVVTVVLCLLASTLLPVLAKSRPTSLAFQCLNNQRQLCAAWRMYADDNRDRMVYASDDGSGSSNPLNQYAWSWFGGPEGGTQQWNPAVDIYVRALWPYTGKNLPLYKCPADQARIQVNGIGRPRLRSMSMNIYLGGYVGTDGGLGFTTKYRIFLRTSDLTAPEPAKMFVFLDGRQDQLIYPGFLTDMAGYPNQPSSYALFDYPNIVHNLGASFSFADGRAEIHRWLDPRTTPPIYQIPPAPTASPRNLDVVWMQDHATRPK